MKQIQMGTTERLNQRMQENSRSVSKVDLVIQETERRLNDSEGFR